MNSGSEREREERAGDALLVSALRLGFKDGECVDPKYLPELTAEEQAAMKALDPDFLEQLLTDEEPAGEPDPVEYTGCLEEGDLAFAGGEMPSGFNRAEVIDDDTAKELERRRREVFERKAGEQKSGPSQSGP